MIYWFMGQPCSGKTTLAKKLKDEVMGDTTLYLDGDKLREIFGNCYSKEHFTREWREEQTQILQRFIAYLVDQTKINVIVATVNPYRDIREKFKQSRKDVVEIYVHKTDKRKRESYNVNDFEPPLINFIDINTTGFTLTNPYVSY